MGKLYLTLNQFSNCYCYTSSSYLFSIHLLVIIRYTSLRTSFNRFILILPCFLDWYVLGTCKSKYDIIWLICWKKLWAVRLHKNYQVQHFVCLVLSPCWHWRSILKQSKSWVFFPISKKKKKSLLFLRKRKKWVWEGRACYNAALQLRQRFQLVEDWMVKCYRCIWSITTCFMITDIAWTKYWHTTDSSWCESIPQL